MSVQKISTKKSSKKLRTQAKGEKLPEFSPGRWLGVGLGLTGVAMISATAGALLAVSLSSTPLMQHKLSPEEAAVFSQQDLAKVNMRLPELTRPVNILVLGVKVITADLTEDDENYPQEELGYHALVNSFKGLSDSMLLIRFNPEKNKLTVLSIPRDTRVYLEGRGIRKINAANFHGGPAGSAKAVSELLGGVGIDRYLRVNVQGVEKLIDAVGGVKVYIPKDMKYQDDSQHLYINLKEGERSLNGDQALQFLRFRRDNLGDIGRVQRQQMLIRAFMEQAVNVKTMGKLPQILSVIQSHIDTNLSIEELIALVGFATKIDRSNVEMLMVPGEFSDPKKYRASYWLPNYDRLDAMIADRFNFGYKPWMYQDIEPIYQKISIQDSNDDWEGVDDLIRTLNAEGYWNVRDYQPWTEPLEVTKIVAQHGDIEGAKAVRDALGFGEVVVESTGHLSSDVTIQLGKDWLIKREEMKLLEEKENYNNW